MTALTARLDFLGAPLDPVSMDEALSLVDDAIESRTRIQQASLNAAKVVRLQNDAVLREAMASCDLVTADGQAVVWAARLLGHAVPERVAGIDLMNSLLAMAARRGHGVYLLGARPDVVEQAAGEIRRRHPGIRIVGTHHGYFDPSEEPAIVADIAATTPDMLFIALETPQKELFLGRHRGKLSVPFAMGVGGAFDVLAGRRKRSPRLVQRLGFEWLFRLVQEPRRLAGRYMVGNSRFLVLVARELTTRRVSDSPRRS
jgi:N-acetylglucosaminyldiphosphoundecaprenol N-acetyl-beta-D-mannosaminyltransferase